MADARNGRLNHIGVIGLIVCSCLAGHLGQRPALPNSKVSLFIDGGSLEPASMLDASSSEKEQTAAIDHRSVRPLFGMETEPALGDLPSKWRAVEFEITTKRRCSRTVAPRNLVQSLETLQTRRGDCEDYAIVKYVALREAGLSNADVKIVILRNLLPNEYHAVAAARVNGEWLILDNRHLTLVRDTDMTRATPKFQLDEDGVHRFVPSNHTVQSPQASPSTFEAQLFRQA